MQSLLLLSLLAADVEPVEPEPLDSGIGLIDVHRALGFTALGAWSTALVIGAASGNLGKLTSARDCCPDGGRRAGTARDIDRVLVNTGTLAYLGAASLAIYNLTLGDPEPRAGHRWHRLLAIAHGSVFAVTAVTGVIMDRSQENDPRTFARAARIHVAANVLLVPLLAIAMSNILFE